MSLTISRSTDITQKPVKLGRNDPCYCGSGKKYKKCHLSLENEYKPKSGLIERIVDWLMAREDFKSLLDNRFTEFFKGKSRVEELEVRPIIEAIIFSDRFNGKTPFEFFLEKADLDNKEKELYRRWLLEGIFSFFEVKSVNIGHSVVIKDIRSGRDFIVNENLGTYGVESGMILLSRIVPYKNIWIFTGGTLQPFPKEAVYGLKRVINLNKKSELNQLELIRLLHNTDKSQQSIDLTYNELKEKLRKEVQAKKIDFDVDAMEGSIERGETFDIRTYIPLFTRNCRNEKEADDLIELLVNFFQAHPRISKKNVKTGPKEKVIIQELLREVTSKNFSKFPDEKRDKMIDEFASRWFNIVQKELDDQTPKEVILNERQELGNPDKELRFEFFAESVTFSEGEQERIYNDGIKLMTKGDVFGALENFAKVVPYVETMTDKFRWYFNVGSCLFAIGEQELAKLYINKSLSINPDYEQARKTLKNLKNKDMVKREEIFGRQRLFDKLLSVGVSFGIDISENEMVEDAVQFLKYIQNHKIILTKIGKNITFNQVLEINNNFIKPNSSSFKIKGSEYRYKSQWQMPKINFLFIVFVVGGLIKKEKNRVILGKAGKLFLTKTTCEKLQEIFTLWFYKTNWPALEERGGWVWTNLTEKPTKILQNMSFFVLSEMKKLERFKSEDLLKNLGYDKRSLMAISVLLESVLLVYLAWMGIIKKKNDLYEITPFGKSFITSLEKQMKNLIPNVLMRSSLTY